MSENPRKVNWRGIGMHKGKWQDIPKLAKVIERDLAKRGIRAKIDPGDIQVSKNGIISAHIDMNPKTQTPDSPTPSPTPSDQYWGTDDETRPRKYAPRIIRNYEPGEIDDVRGEVFEQGSMFKPTAREEIIGIDNVLTEVDQIIHWLKHSKEYQRYDSRLEPGVIFEGDPGTGKTLVSRYIASESNALFISVRDFPIEGSLWKGTDIHDLFSRARRRYAETQKPIVLFWDEFEGAALERGEATPEQASAVSQLTAELDGVHGKNEGILLIGCTNYIYGIDAALKRSGRMGVQIEFHAPDRGGKRLLLDYYLGKFDLTGQIDVETLSFFFDSDATAADIEEACVEAWRFAIWRSIEQEGEPSLNQEDLMKVFIKRLVGPPTSFINLPSEDSERIAVHEVGHALTAIVYEIPLRLITVQPGKKSLGRVMTFEIREHIASLDEYVSQIRVALGSLAAEEVAELPSMVGSSMDVQQANHMATKLVDRLNAGAETKLLNLSSISDTRENRVRPSPSISEGVISRADADIATILESGYDDALRVMKNIGKDDIWSIAKRVDSSTTMTGDEFKTLVSGVLGTDDFSRYR